ncbi:MAG: hypothetical protein C4519_24310 [Desulfobacteraceae bacterium]|nr:MAG: hypothetical protein C4519_24310 [Desulfobacteraceae bacterium]
MAEPKNKDYSIIDDLNNLEFRVFVCYYLFDWKDSKIASRLNLHIIEVNQMLKDIRNLSEFERLKEDVLEAFLF